jgi:tRNA(Ile)-lysidine synthase
VARSTLYEDFLAFVRRHDLLPRGARVIVAVSGGPDSVALFDILKRFSARGRIALFACHLDHKLRGADSDRDAKFVKDLCRESNTPLALGRRDVAKLATDKGLTVEAAAREARYKFFASAARRFKSRTVATAHTLSDNAETILQRLIEGAGPHGLAGIPVSRTLDSASRVRVVRPLLFASRAEIENYLASRGLSFRTDKTNLAPLYLRNRIRLEVLPALRKLNPAIEETISRAGASVAALSECVEGLVAAAREKIILRRGETRIVLDRAALCETPPAIAAEVLKSVLREAGAGGREISAANIGAVMKIAAGKKPSARANLPGGVRVAREYGKIIVEKGRARFSHESVDGSKKPLTTSAQNASSYFESFLKVPGRVTFPGGALRIEAKLLRRLDLRAFLTRKTSDEEVIDAACVTGALSVHAPRRGEHFRSLGAHGERKLSDFFIDLKVPAAARATVPIVSDDRGIVWVAGFRMADRVKITRQTKRFLHLSLRRR